MTEVSWTPMKELQKFKHEFFDTFGNKVREEKSLMEIAELKSPSPATIPRGR